LFDKISTEAEFPSKSSFVFCFLFWEKKDVIWFCLADIGRRKEYFSLTIWIQKLF
jgi:hypothetical protein